MKQRLISTAQLALTLFLVIILTSCSTQPPQAKTKEPPKNKIIENWTRTTITLYRSPSSLNSFHPDDAVQELEAKKAVYDSWESSNREYVEMEVIVFADPKSGRIYIGSRFPFFTETKSGIFGMAVDEGGIGWMPGLINVSEISGGIEEAISQFEKKFDYYNEFLAPSAGDRGGAGTGLYTALGGGFPGGGSATSSRPKVVSVNIRGEILELDLESLSGESKANVWVNMQTRAVIKALRDGKTPPPPPPTEPPPKNKIIKNWTSAKITLYRSPSSLDSFHPGDAVEEIKAKQAVYGLRDYPSENYFDWEFVTFTDRKSGRAYFGPGRGYFDAPAPVFIETKSGIFALHASRGSIDWAPGLVNVSPSTGGIKGAISRFERGFDLHAFLEQGNAAARSEPSSDWTTALGWDLMGGSAIAGPPKILRANVNGQILKLDLEDYTGQYKAHVWLNMETRAVVKALMDEATPLKTHSTK